jgi:hypothetical protein
MAAFVPLNRLLLGPGGLIHQHDLIPVLALVWADVVGVALAPTDT